MSPGRSAEITAHELEARGLDVGALFKASPVAYRRVDQVADGAVEVEGTRLPGLHLGPVAPGHWLRFEHRDGGLVRVSVDLDASRKAEKRLSGLFDALKK